MIFFASDLHYGHNQTGDASATRLAKFIKDKANTDDVLCLCGDIGASQTSFERALDLFADFPGAKCAVLGNHDIWVSNESDSWNEMQHKHKTMRAYDFTPLDEEPLIKNHLAIVGTMGWYDYSFRDEALGIPDAAYEQKMDPATRSLVWNDGQYVRWHLTDAEATAYFAKKLDAHLQACKNSQEVVVAMHHLPTKKLLFHPRWLVPRSYRLINTFLGSESFAKIISKYPRVKHVLCGHAHMSWQTRINEQTFTCIGSDYSHKQFVTLQEKKLQRQNVRSWQP